MEAEHTIKHRATVKLPTPSRVTMADAADAVGALGRKAPSKAEVFYDQKTGVLTAEWTAKE